MTGASPDPASPYTTSFALYQSLGWQGVIPVAYLDKAPPPDGFTGFDGKWPTKGRAERWASEGPQNMALRLPDTVIGVDVDNYAKINKKGVRVTKNGAAQLAEFEAKYGKLPPTWSSTKRDPTGASRIHFYRVPPGTLFPESIAADIDVIQFGHRYAVVYPSVMPDEDEDGTYLLYSWFDPELQESHVPPAPGDLTLLPPNLIEAMQAAGPVKSKQDEGKAARGKSLGIYLPPDDPGRTNEWLTARAGELAIVFRHDRNRFLEYVKLIDSSSADPHALADLEKTALSVWNREQGKQVPGAGTSVTGGLYSQSGRLMTEDKDGNEIEFANFDMKVLGKVRAADGITLDGYNVALHNDRTKRTTEVYLPRKVLADPRSLHAWLVGYEVTMLRAMSAGIPAHVCLQAYLSAQRARDLRIVPFWGWDDQAQGFITDKGVIRASGLEVDPTVKPDPNLVQRGLARYRYGFEFDETRAGAILREVLTFQDETVTSVVGAWWVATKLKGQIMQAAALFPVLVVEAASESGKTTGFFELLYKLDGNLGEASVNSPAAFRNRLAVHRNGIVWYDDPEELTAKTKEYIRNATAENEAAKSDMDNSGNVTTRLVAPIMLSGEGFGLDHEKALADRVIQIGLPDPKGRRSIHDPSRSQWDDIIDFKRTHPDLTMASGTLVAMILSHANVVEELPSLRPGSGRYADKMAVLRVGARVLAKITGDPSHVDRVDEWCGVQIDRGNENTLTLHVIPSAFRTVVAEHDPVKIDRPPYHGIPTPVVVRPDKNGETAIWVNFDHLADWWLKHNRSSEVRVTTAKAFLDQSKAIGMRGQTGEHGIDWYKSTVRDERNSKTGARPSYQRLPQNIAARLLADYGDLGSPRQPADERVRSLVERSARMRPTSPPNRP